MKSRAIVCLALGVALTGCAMPSGPLTTQNSQLTQGNVEMNLKVGKTTKSQVLEKFGAPNVTTRDGQGDEVWTYQRQAQVSQSSAHSGYWSVILAGQKSSADGFESTSRMITLIIKFNKHDVVSDFSSRTSNF